MLKSVTIAAPRVVQPALQGKSADEVIVERQDGSALHGDWVLGAQMTTPDGDVIGLIEGLILDEEDGTANRRRGVRGRLFRLRRQADRRGLVRTGHDLRRRRNHARHNPRGSRGRTLNQRSGNASIRRRPNRKPALEPETPVAAPWTVAPPEAPGRQEPAGPWTASEPLDIWRLAGRANRRSKACGGRIPRRRRMTALDRNFKEDK